MPPIPRLRFAPSPTGRLHLGGLRTALFNYLFARKNGGKWLLRIEDTDQTRSRENSVDEIRKGLEWAGLDYDEGPGVGGKYGPYIQSQRLDLYHSHAHSLLQKDRAYRCFCDPAKLEATRLRLQQAGSYVGYDRTCRRLEPADVKHFLQLGKPHCIRLSTPDALPPSFTDLIFGNPTPHPVPVDPIIVKTDGFPTYHLASVVDDHAMDITHVLRGEEWLPSVPLHLTIYSAFGWSPPEFAHLPLLLNEDGSKMSKRSEYGAAVVETNQSVYEPEAVLNWIAITGWSGKRDPHAKSRQDDMPAFLTLSEMIQKFDLANYTNRRTILSKQKLEYLNKKHIQAKLEDPNKRRLMAEAVVDTLKPQFPSSLHMTVEFVEKALVTLQGSLQNRRDFAQATAYLFQEPNYNDPAAVKLRRSIPDVNYHKAVEVSLKVLEAIDEAQWTEENIKAALNPLADSVGGMKPLMGSLRHAALGGKHGAGIAATFGLLGKETTIQRLRASMRLSLEDADGNADQTEDTPHMLEHTHNRTP